MSPREERNGDTGSGGERRNSGSFTVFETISFNVVIPITNVLCYFWRRFFGRTKSSTFPFFAPPTHFHFFFVFLFDVSSALLLVPLRSVEHGAACSAKLAIKTWKIMSFHERSRFKLNSRLYANSFHFI